MKKIFAVLASLVMVFMLAACSGNTNQGTSEGTEENSSESNTTGEVSTEEVNSAENVIDDEGGTEQDAQGTNILVVYFSATGTTEGVAEYIANGLGADIYEIIPEDSYTDADLNYNDNDSRSTIEMNDPDFRPAISGSVDNMEQYDTVFIGYPIWWGEAPRIVSTFMESYDFSGKTIVPFCTSGGSGIGSSADNLEELTSGAEWVSGQRFNGSESQDEVMEWVNGLGLIMEE